MQMGGIKCQRIIEEEHSRPGDPFDLALWSNGYDIGCYNFPFRKDCSNFRQRRYCLSEDKGSIPFGVVWKGRSLHLIL